MIKSILNFILYLLVGTVPVALLSWLIVAFFGWLVTLPQEVVSAGLVAIVLAPVATFAGFSIVEAVRMWWHKRKYIQVLVTKQVVVRRTRSTSRGPSPASHSD